MRLFVFIANITLLLVSCQRDIQKQAENIDFCETSVPYVVGMGNEVFEDSSNDVSKYQEVDGVVKGDRIWKIENFKKIDIICDLHKDIKQLVVSEDAEVKAKIIYVWHTYSILKIGEEVYGVSINFEDALIMCEKLISINGQSDLMKSDLSGKRSFIVSLNYLQENHSCLYQILKDRYKSAKVNIGDIQYGFHYSK